MGSTYSVDKRAAALVAPNGTIYYALFEQTYESNVWPRTPRWCARFFGTAEACMERIVAWSTDCEGGMLKGSNGDISPSTYIKQWREAMATPVEFAGRVKQVEFGDGLYKLDPDKRDAAAVILARHGHPGIHDNKVVIDVRYQPEILADLISEMGYAWRFLDIHNSSANKWATTWAAYTPAANSVKLPGQIEVFYLPDPKLRPDNEHWIRIDGKVMHTGWEYSTIRRLIGLLAVEAEKRVPGSAENVIKQIRRLVKQKQAFLLDQEVRVDPAMIGEAWRTSQFKHLAEKLGLDSSGPIKFTLRQACTADAVYEFGGMPDEAVEFIDLPPAREPGEQQQLLAA